MNNSPSVIYSTVTLWFLMGGNPTLFLNM